MAHPFQDKLIVFIGTPLRCKRQAARDALVEVGGIPDETITAFTNFVVAFNRADGTKVYNKALEHEGYGLLSILTEEQFFDILNGKSLPPVKPKREMNVIVIPAKNQEAYDRESEQFMADYLNRKRINNMARHGIPTPDGRIKVDMRQLEKMSRVIKAMKEKE